MYITNDDVQPDIYIYDLAIIEGDTGVFGVSLSAVSGLPVVFTYQSYDGTAAAGVDFTGLSATVVTIAPYTSSSSVTLATSEDLINEGDENFTISLSAVSGAGIGDALALGTITDDDGPPPLHHAGALPPCRPGLARHLPAQRRHRRDPRRHPRQPAAGREAGRPGEPAAGGLISTRRRRKTHRPCLIMRRRCLNLRRRRLIIRQPR